METMPTVVYDIDDLIMDNQRIKSAYPPEVIDLTTSDEEDLDEDLPSLWDILHGSSPRRDASNSRPAGDTPQNYDSYQEEALVTLPDCADAFPPSKTPGTPHNRSQGVIMQTPEPPSDRVATNDGRSDLTVQALVPPHSQGANTAAICDCRQEAHNRNIHSGLSDEERRNLEPGRHHASQEQVAVSCLQTTEDHGGRMLVDVNSGDFLGVYGEREAVQGGEYLCLVALWLRPESGAPCQQIRECQTEMIRQTRVGSLGKRKRETDAADVQVLRRVRRWRGYLSLSPRV